MLSDRGLLTVLAFIGQSGVVCCRKDNIDQFPLNNYFPAQSLHFHYGSAVPCPTLRAYVTSSPPRTRYGRSATPYPTGFPCYDIISLQRPLAQSVENSLRCFRSSHPYLLLYHIFLLLAICIVTSIVNFSYKETI